MMTGGQLHWLPLAAWERDGLKAALKRVGLPYKDVEAPGRYFWRFEEDDVPVGFGGIETHGEIALLRSLVILPPLRHHGLGHAITAALEGEAVALGARALYLVTAGEAPFFAEQGFAPCSLDNVPPEISACDEFCAAAPGAVIVMTKRLG